MVKKIKEKYIVLTTLYRREGDVWTAECKELGTATFGDTFEEAEAHLREAIELHLSTLEDVKECERFFRQNNITVYETKLPRIVKVELPVSPDTWVNRNVVALH